MKALSRVSFGQDGKVESSLFQHLKSPSQHWHSTVGGAPALSVAPRVTEDTQSGKPTILR